MSTFSTRKKLPHRSSRHELRRRFANSRRALLFESLEGRDLLALAINVGNHVLLPNTPNQQIPISVTGGDLVNGVIVEAQIANSDPTLLSSMAPSISDLDIISAGTIFQPNNTGEVNPETFFPTALPRWESRQTTTTGTSTLSAAGVVAIITIDTTGYTRGPSTIWQWPLLLGGADFVTNFADTRFNIPTSPFVVSPAIVNGAITLDNPPIANAGGAYSVGEGSSVALNGLGSSDPDTTTGDTISYQWDLNYNGVNFDVDATGATPTFSAAAINGPGARTIALRVTDSYGMSSIATTSVTINNLAPSVAAANGSIAVFEGQTAANSGTFGDPGNDGVTITSSIGSITQGAGVWNWTYATTDGPDQTQTVTITATDSDGAVSTTTFNLSVSNVAPTVTRANGAVIVNEGQTATNSGTYSDPGNDFVVVSASVGSILFSSGGWTWSYAATNGPLQSQTVTITATDSDGAASTTTFELTVNNLPPTVARDNALVTVGEGQTATNSGTYGDPGADTVSLSASIGVIVPGAGTWTWSYPTIDGPDENQTVTITATDSDGAVTTTSFILTVNNVAPTVARDLAVVTVNEGQTATNSGAYFDPGDDTVTLTASVGAIIPGPSGTWTWSFPTTDGPDETQLVTITATDSDGAATSTTFNLVVNNAAPSLAINNATVTVSEGQTATNSGTFSDPGNDGVVLTASVGVVAPGAGTWTWTYLPADGPDATQTVTIYATDSDGLVTTQTFSLVVNNAPPTLAVADPTITVQEGQTATNQGIYGDPGVDTVTLSASIGTIVRDSPSSGAWTWTYNTTDGPDQSQTVTVTATDSDGAVTTKTFQLVVNNVAPTVAADVGTVTFQEGQTAANTGTFNDPGADVVTITASIGVVTQGAGTWSWSFPTTDGPDETQTVTITATDSDGATSTTTFQLVVTDAQPDVAADQPTVAVIEGATAVNTGTFSDPGSDTVTITASVGTITQTSGTWSWSYPTTDGPDQSQTVVITATDSDGVMNTTSFLLTVNNAAPTLAANNAGVTVNEGQTAVNSGTFGDAGADAVTITASVGAIVQGAGVWSWSYLTSDGPDQSQTVTITATDSDGAVSTTTFALTVLNLAPSVTRDNATVTVNEGQVATNSGAFSDVAADAVTITASAGTVTQGAGTWSWSLLASDGPASQTITITATDSDGAATTTTFNLVVNNVAPTVNRDNASVSVNEGQTATNTGTFSDPGVDTVTITASAGTITQGAGTWSWSLATTDGPDQSQTITITATDSDGATSTTTFSLVVNNVAPSVAASNPTVTVTEGATATNSGTFNDPGLDTVAITASVGSVTQSAGTWSWSYATADGPDQSQTVTITATDSDGATSTTTFSLVVNNAPPAVAANNASVTVNEGQTATNSGTFGDVGADAVTITASVGSITQDAGTWSWSYPTSDGPDQSQTVTITATDSDGAVSTTTFALTVNNLAPTVNRTSASVTVNEGQTVTNTGAYGDVPADTVTITASVGSITQGAGTWSWSFNTTDGPAQSQTVTITATDSDGASSTTTFALVVNNVAPVVAADQATVTVNEGQTASNTGTFGDAGSDVVLVTASAGTLTQGAGTWSWSYPTTDGPDQTQTVTITATDSDGAISTTTFNLVVNNTAPTVNANSPSVTVNEGQTAANSGTFSDPGADTVTISASVGTITQGAGTWSWSYPTTDGPDESQTVTITATDSDGATSTTTFALVVNNLAPTVNRTNALVTVNEGQTATNSGTFSDPGADAVTITASVGTITQGAGTWSWNYPTTDGPDETQLVTITATDSDGAFSTVTFNLAVNNVAPSVAADNAAVTVDEGDTATNTGTYSDPGNDGVTITASIGTITQGSGAWSWSYPTVDGSDVTVTITATDTDGASTSTSFTLTVNNLAPNVAADNASVTRSEGQTAANTGTYSAAGTATVTITASAGVITQDAGVWSWSYPTTDGPDQTQVVTITATDSDGLVSTTSFNLVVNNVAPSVAANNATITVNEGQVATNSGAFSDPGADGVTITASAGTITQGAGTWSWSLGANDGPLSQVITITATDSDGAATTTTFNLVVNNVAPTVNRDNVSVSVNEGQTATNTGTFSDPGVDTVTITASAGTITQGAGTWSWSLATTDGPDQSQTITITATDSDGATSTTTFNLVVNNVAPSVAANSATVTVTEGATATNAGTFNDPGLDTVAITASVGTITQGAGVWNWSYATTDGPDQSQTVTITATDSDGAVSTTTFSLVVNNTPPAVAANNASVTVNEGQTATNSGTFGDVGADAVTITASVGSITQGAGTWSWSYPTSDGPDQSQTVTVTATDSDGAVSTTTFALTVNNLAPTVNRTSASVTVNEGQTATNTGVYGDVPADTVTITASVGSITQGAGTWSWSFNTTDGPAQSQTVTITATDSDGASSTTTFALVVNNVAPIVGSNHPMVIVGEGATAINSGTYSDSDSVVITASVGTILQGAGTWSWSYPTTDGPDQTQTVTITATDSDGATSTTTFSLVVNNIAPTVAANAASITVNEGVTAANSGTFSDPGADTVTVSASVGTITQGAGTWSWSYPATDGPDQSQTVTITATDSDGGFTTTTFNLVVNNVAPAAAATNATVTVSEGQTATNSGTFSDPGADVVTITASVGTIIQGAGTWSWSYPTTDGPDQSQTVTITATDSDGASSATTFGLIVNNVPPLVAANNASVTVNEGQTAASGGTFSDAGADTVSISASVGTITQGVGTWSWSYPTTDGPDQNQTVTITATDSDGATSTTTFTLVVNNVAPTVASNNASLTVNEGQTATNSGTFGDPGADTVTITASVGAIVQGAGTWSWSFATTDGPDQSQTVTITATDSDGAVSTTTFSLNVNNMAPTASAGGPYAKSTLETFTLNGSASDPGADTLSYAWDLDYDGVTFDVNTTGATPSVSYAVAGIYTAALRVTDSDGAATIVTASVTITDHSTVIGQKVFYNNSVWDSVSDNNAIATDKTALLPGGTATFANYTSYVWGLNGIMIDVDNLPGAGVVTAADFTFRAGNDNNPSGWSSAVASPAVTVVSNGGAGGADRIVLTWPNYNPSSPATTAVAGKWLEITVVANAATGLNANYVFYFGNAIGETGDSSSFAMVNATDQIAIRANPKNAVFNPAAISNPYDINRDKAVDSTDEIIARTFSTSPLTMLRLITVPGPSMLLSLPGPSGEAPASASADSQPAYLGYVAGDQPPAPTYIFYPTPNEKSDGTAAANHNASVDDAFAEDEDWLTLNLF